MRDPYPRLLPTKVNIQQDFNLLDAQQEACTGLYPQPKRTPAGRCYGAKYDDGGFSGGHLRAGPAAAPRGRAVRQPLPRGEGFAFRDEVVGGAIPRQYIPAVEKGVLETFAQGGVHGYPVVDVVVTVDDGKAHSVDSNEVSFKMAAALAVRAAMAEAGPIVLEPVSKLSVTIPSECQGDVMGDLHSRRARIIGTDPAEDGYQTVTATAPTAELTRYAVDLRALTGGRGSFTVEYDHYDPVPDHLVASIPRMEG